MATPRVADILKMQALMESRRGNAESLWEDLAPYFSPLSAEYMRGNSMSSNRLTNPEIVDVTAQQSLRDYVAILSNITTPRNQKWHGLSSGVAELDKSRAVQQYFQKVNDTLFLARGLNKANFYRNNFMRLKMFATFGPGVLYVDEELGDGLRYRVISPKEVYMLSDADGYVRRVHRKFKLQAHQAVMKFKDDNLPQVIKDMAKNKPETEYEFIHAFYPNEMYDPQSRLNERLRYASCYVEVSTQTEVRRGGFNTFRYSVCREPTMPNDDYGISHAAFMLPEAKMVNAIDRSNIKTMQLRNAPPLLTHDDGSLRKFRIQPGAINAGALDAAGREKVKPLNLGTQSEMGVEMAEMRRNIIRKSFFNDLYRFFIENPNMKATTAMSALQERAALLTPIVTQIEDEGLTPMIAAELDILNAAGVLPDMPGELREAGGFYKVQFLTPISRAQKAEEAYGAESAVQRAVSIAGVAPEVMDTIDLDEFMRITSAAEGAPASLFRPDEAVQARRAQRQQDQQAMLDAQAAPAAAAAMKDIAQAEKLSRAAA